MNQPVLVTAGASGIGSEIARFFAANAVKVFVSGNALRDNTEAGPE